MKSFLTWAALALVVAAVLVVARDPVYWLQIAILRTGGPLARDWDDGRIPNLVIRGAHDFVVPAAQPGADIRQLVPHH